MLSTNLNPAMLLAPFRVEMLARGHAAPLARLAARYGEPWTDDLVAAWFGRDRPRPAPWNTVHAAWFESLPSLCEAMSAVGDDGTSPARLLAAGSWFQLRESIGQRLRLTPPSHREQALGELGPSVAAVLASTAATAATDLRDEAVKFLCQDNDDLVACLMPALRAARALPPDLHCEAGLDVIAQRCAKRLAARLARPQRADDDWSVEFPSTCGCELCAALGRFLGDPERRSFEWPLAEQKRRHVHARIDMAELPVRHETRRTGRPYTLVLTKTRGTL